MVCVLPGLLDTRAAFFRFNKRLIKEDFPTLERPTNASSGNGSTGYCSGLTALIIKSTVLIIIFSHSIRNKNTLNLNVLFVLYFPFHQQALHSMKQVLAGEPLLIPDPYALQRQMLKIFLQNQGYQEYPFRYLLVIK